MNIFIIINTLIFTTLSIVHFYWALGGKWAWDSALPTRPEGQFLFRPTAMQTSVVALGLMMFAIITAANSGFLDDLLDRKYVHFGTRVIAVVFMLRAVGDFNYIGFTKRTRNTRFALMDTRLYSPLCLIVSIFSFFSAGS